MAYLKVILLVSMATCLIADSAVNHKADLAEGDLDTANTFGLGYVSPYGMYGGLGYGGYSSYSRFGWPNYYGGYYGGYGNYGYPRFGYRHGYSSYYGHGYPYYYGGYYG